VSTSVVIRDFAIPSFSCGVLEHGSPLVISPWRMEVGTFLGYYSRLCFPYRPFPHRPLACILLRRDPLAFPASQSFRVLLPVEEIPIAVRRRFLWWPGLSPLFFGLVLAHSLFLFPGVSLLPNCASETIINFFLRDPSW